ncbi:hypothetical protein K450DRAFT_229209 [Umbelopsis ramanniana AG]|uniref:HSF-type DNA-binding domain-containing protein n=1 Tax=Umbelopsis ramanniana AG TaxID=1314678 RepID=A0AAD5EFA5_UMBRA|nr:uncharacterized protein K450DRAFT_229209 [Umbelopsis ramanniana AG]KAI8582139.1 hypothetical protein K450DRAFT_229209 [Umbelopsis ramanniana AG]
MEQRATSGPFSSALYSTLPIPVSLDAKEFISPPLTNEFTSPPLTEKSIPLSLPNEFISPSLTNDFISPSLTNDSVSSFLANDFTSPSLFLPNLSPVQFTSDDLELDLHYNEVPYKSEKTDKIPSLRPPNDYNVNFVRRLYDMVTDSRFQHLISWSLDGSSFLVKNTPTFAQMVLPAYFRNTRLNDFRRQLYK